MLRRFALRHYHSPSQECRVSVNDHARSICPLGSADAAQAICYAAQLPPVAAFCHTLSPPARYPSRYTRPSPRQREDRSVATLMPF